MAVCDRGGAGEGSRVLVHGGSGGVGQAVVQLAAAAGMTVVATAGTPQGKTLVEKCGAAAVYNHREPGVYYSVIAVVLDSV